MNHSYELDLFSEFEKHTMCLSDSWTNYSNELVLFSKSKTQHNHHCLIPKWIILRSHIELKIIVPIPEQLTIRYWFLVNPSIVWELLSNSQMNDQYEPVLLSKWKPVVQYKCLIHENENEPVTTLVWTWGSTFSQLAQEKSSEKNDNLFADAACFDIL